MTEELLNQGQTAPAKEETTTAPTNLEEIAVAADQEAEAAEAAVKKAEPTLEELESMNAEDLEKLLSGMDGTEGKPEGEATAPKTDGVSEAAGETPPQFAATTKPNVMIPKARLDEVLEKNRKLEEEVAFHKGKAAGLKEAGVNTEAPPQADPQVMLQQYDVALTKLEAKYIEERDKIADKYEAGGLNEKQKLRAYDALDKKRSEVEETILRQKEKLVQEYNTPTPEQIISDSNLVAATAQLYADEPWLKNLPSSAVKKLQQLTEQSLAEEGVRLGQSAEDTWKLRAGMALVGKELGMDIKFASKGGNPPSAANQLKPTPEQLAAKLALAGKVPPAPGAAGTTNAVVTSDLQQLEDNTRDQTDFDMGMNHSPEYFRKIVGV